MNAGEIARLMHAREWARALEEVDRALQRDAQDPKFLMQRAQCLMALGRRQDAFAAAQAAEKCAPGDAALLDAAGSLYSFGNDQPRALAAYERALALAPHSAQFLYNRATVRRYLGQLAGAEQDYDRVIALSSADYEAYKNRTDLRTQTAERNHIAELESLLARPIADWRGEVQVRYALAKEHEDLGNFARSFEHLSRGAAKRHEHLRYDIATDVATVQWIIEAFPAGPSSVAQGQCTDAPIFIVGLPRSGTTLVERILDSHSAVFSAGELDAFALGLVDAVRRSTGRVKMSRRELVAESASVDFAALGRDYLQRAYAASDGTGRFVDKMPLNYLYCGLILRALPNARIVHVTRHPMALCYAMFKTLFKDGYPFSYDLDEIGRYYGAYRRLMAHWQATMPGAIYEMSYEALVGDLPGETQRLLAFCGLDWQDGCVQFHQNPAASTTASAVQIRRPIYDTSIDQWRHYARQLAPLRSRLEAAGIEIK